MKALFLLNASPFADERTYNALRLATALATNTAHQVRVYLMGESVSAARAGQAPRKDGYSPCSVLERIAEASATPIIACGSCLDTRGLGQGELVSWVRRGTLDELVESTAWADQVLVY
jgi:uncharacterized protein involved in oxidation of intracellular sulfur